jgi:CubicO group peptidase (beta-lactamase class C family)
MKNLLTEIENLLAQGVESKHFTHAALAVGSLHSDEVEIIKCSNDQNREIFDLASMTKSFSTGFLIHELVEKERLNLDITVSELINCLGITLDVVDIIKQQRLSDLLGHRSIFPAWGCLWINRLSLVDNLWEDRDKHIISHLNRIASTRPEPKACYSDLGYIFLGLLLEKHYGTTLDKVFEDRVGKNLKSHMKYHATRNTSEDSYDSSKMISTGFCKIRERDLFGEVHDENCGSLGGVSGHAGLFSTVEGCVELLKFYFKEENRHFYESNAKMVTNDPSSDGLLGMRQNIQESIKEFGQGRAIGHLGFTGTSFYINPTTNDYVIFLTNRVIKARLSNDIVGYRKEVHKFAEKYFNSK